MDIKILGTGCPKCKMLEKNASEAVSELGIDATIEKVTEIDKIMEYNIMMTPGLVINGKVKAFGRVPGKEEIKKLIQDEM
ncbi:TM0996/MTH895 family glutaredoxin-like protein [Caldicoprobacter algeriensis]|uniref:thioredoxin family protein n=1 Tax=Caldicoprobacter algeriensis TaxID=699281 RepID=UPI00207A2679|nr:TM0996/MTH895 family glutaredoxin-like protein [Caldicoprobacter algeriensis]